MPGIPKCPKCHERLKVKPVPGAALDSFDACANCFGAPDVTPELIQTFERTIAVMRRSESESPRVMILVEQLLAALKSQYDLIHMPHTEEWHGSVDLEAAFQVDNWGVAHDDGKMPENFLFLIGHLASKCCRAATELEQFLFRDGSGQVFAVTGSAARHAELLEKAKHHTISVGAVCLNWHRRLSGQEMTFQPGIDSPWRSQQCEAQCRNCEPPCQCSREKHFSTPMECFFDCAARSNNILELPPL